MKTGQQHDQEELRRRNSPLETKMTLALMFFNNSREKLL